MIVLCLIWWVLVVVVRLLVIVFENILEKGKVVVMVYRE